MTKLTTSVSTNKNQLIKQSIEKFFYKTRVNIALRNILVSEAHNQIEQMFSEAIKKQLLMFTKKSVIDDIIGVSTTKADYKTVDNPDIFDGLMRHWLVLLALIDDDLFNKYLIDAANAGGQSALSKLQSNLKFELTDESVLKNLRLRVDESIALIEQTTQLWLVKLIRNGLQENMSAEEIAKLIKSVIHQTVTNRGELIAEHEAALVLGQVELEVYRRSGVKYHLWVTARDELVCEVCMGNEEAGKIEVGSLFPSGVLTTPAHHRCRCFLMPVKEDKLNLWTGT